MDWFFGAKKPVNTRNDLPEENQDEEETKVQNIEIT